MIPFEAITGLPEYQQATPEKQQQVRSEYARDFWSEVYQDPDFVSADERERADLQAAFDRQFGINIRDTVENQIEGERNNFLQNMWELVKSGGENTLTASRIAGDVASGEMDANAASVLAESILKDRQKYTPPELKELQESVTTPAKDFESAEGLSGKSRAIWDMIKTVAYQSVFNPKGLAYMTSEQAGNMAPGITGMVVGAKAGGAAGAAVGPGGAAIGGVAGGVIGGFLGQWGVEAGSEFKGMIAKELQNRELEPTEENVLSLLADDSFVENSVSNARNKATATALVSVAMNLAAGKIASAPYRAAQQAAIAKVGASAGDDAISAATKEILASRTLAQKVSTGAKAYGTGLAEEPLSEAAGQQAGYGKVDLGEVALETMGGIGGTMADVPAAAYSYGAEKIPGGQPSPTPEPTPITPTVPDTAAILAGESIDEAIAAFRQTLGGDQAEAVFTPAETPSTAEGAAAVFETMPPSEVESELLRREEAQAVASGAEREGVVRQAGLEETFAAEPPKSAEQSVEVFRTSPETDLEKQARGEEALTATFDRGDVEARGGEPAKTRIEQATETFAAAPKSDLDQKFDRTEAAAQATGTTYATAPTEKAERREAVAVKIEDQGPDFTAAKGKPFASEKALRMSAKQKGVDLGGYKVVPYQNGFIAVPKPQGLSEAKTDLYWSRKQKEYFPKEWTDADEKGLQESEVIASREVVPAVQTVATKTSVVAGQDVNVAPTDPQKVAGNYLKGHTRLDGFDLSIENPAGSERSGVGEDGEPWTQKMANDYGYFKGTVGFDKDHLDTFIAPGYTGGNEQVFVVNQYKANGKFDEHKVVLGAKSQTEAMKIYNSNYAKGWKGGKSVVQMGMEQFREWAQSDAPQDGAAQTIEPPKRTVSYIAKQYGRPDFPEGTQVEVTAVREDNGREIKVKEEAHDALDRIESSIEKYYKLLGCIQS